MNADTHVLCLGCFAYHDEGAPCGCGYRDLNYCVGHVVCDGHTEETSIQDCRCCGNEKEDAR